MVIRMRVQLWFVNMCVCVCVCVWYFGFGLYGIGVRCTYIDLLTVLMYHE